MTDKNKLKEFPESKLRALAGIYHGDGIQVIFDIMEDECNQTENDFLGQRPLTPEDSFVLHSILHAKRLYFISVVAKIDNLMDQYSTGSAKDNNRFKDKLENLLSAVPMNE